MARKKRRTYSLEYKLETVALVLERGLSPRQVAKDLGIEGIGNINAVRLSQTPQADLIQRQKPVRRHRRDPPAGPPTPKSTHAPTPRRTGARPRRVAYAVVCA